MSSLRSVDETGRLFVGSNTAYDGLEDGEVEFILNLSYDCNASFGMKRSYAHLPFPDGNSEYLEFRQRAELLWNRYRRTKEDILVHCAAGISRSVSVAASTVALAEDLSFGDALYVVQQRRGVEQDPLPELQEYGRRFVEEER